MLKVCQYLLLVLILGIAGCNNGVAPAIMLPEASHTAVPSTPVQISSTPTQTVIPTQTSISIPEILPFTDQELKGQLDRLAKQYLQGAKNSALSIAFVQRSQQTGQLEAMLLNYGTTIKEGDVPVTSNTIYEIGSITKVFTGILLAQAVNNGDIKLDDPIQKYFPENIHAPTYRDDPIRVVDLATHHSSLPRDANSDDIQDIYSWLDSYELSHTPGMQYVYSNFGFSLLGDILARRSGSDFDSLEYSAISQPLSMTDTREILSAAQKARLAQGYTNGGSRATPFPDSGAMGPAGYLRSTLTDMTRFLIANMQPDSTPLASSLRLTQTMQTEGRDPGSGIGLGWEISQPGTPDERIWKGGDTPGFSSYISFEPNGDWGFVVLSNGHFMDSFAAQIIRLLREDFP